MTEQEKTDDDFFQRTIAPLQGDALPPDAAAIAAVITAASAVFDQNVEHAAETAVNTAVEAAATDAACTDTGVRTEGDTAAETSSSVPLAAPSYPAQPRPKTSPNSEGRRTMLTFAKPLAVLAASLLIHLTRF